MEEHLIQISKSYDEAIDSGRKGTDPDPYKILPKSITDNKNYHLFEKMLMENNLSDSGRKQIFDYLSPKSNMKFIDLGCCLNLMFRGYKDWESTYYGIDISKKTIELLEEYVKKNKLFIGSLCCCSIHQTPYDSNFFDIGSCIGSLEYFEKEFIEKAIIEIHRIMKSNGKLVLDIPNVGSPDFKITALIEEYLGRKDRFNISIKEFETILNDYFKIEKKEIVGPMIQYFLICKK